MTDSRQLARLIGPTMIALGLTEALNLEMFARQIAPVVYLDGTLLFVGGLALIDAHSRWTWHWSVLITITGWVLLAGGLYRMIAPDAPPAPQSELSYLMLGVLGIVGLFLTYKGYHRARLST